MFNKVSSVIKCKKSSFVLSGAIENKGLFLILLTFLFLIVLVHFEFAFSFGVFPGSISLLDCATCRHYCWVAHTLLSLISVGLVYVIVFFLEFLLFYVFLFKKQFVQGFFCAFLPALVYVWFSLLLTGFTGTFLPLSDGSTGPQKCIWTCRVGDL